MLPVLSLNGAFSSIVLYQLWEELSTITGRETKKNENSVVSQQKHSIVTFCFHRQEFQHFSPPKGASGIPTSYSAYYNISVAKAELLNKLKQQPEMAEAGLGEEGVDYELAQKR
jgi:hypothetical protein